MSKKKKKSKEIKSKRKIRHEKRLNIMCGEMTREFKYIMALAG